MQLLTVAEVPVHEQPLQLKQRSILEQSDDSDILAFLEEDDDEELVKSLNTPNREIPKFEIDQPKETMAERHRRLLEKLQNGPDIDSRDAAAQQLMRMNLLRKD